MGIYSVNNQIISINNQIISDVVSDGGNDADAQAFIDAAGITDSTQQSAINTFVVGLKAQSLWTKFDALYPMVGGTATTHKYNLKDPTAYEIVWNGGWTHSSTGALGNAANTYGNTQLVPNTVLSLNDAHISYYSRTNNTTLGIEIGSMSNSSWLHLIGLSAYYYGKTPLGLFFGTINDYKFLYYDVGVTTGLFLSSREISSSSDNYHNGSWIQTVNENSDGLSLGPISIGAVTWPGGSARWNNRECAMASIGFGMDATEQANFYTLVQAFQTTLGRNV